MNAENVAFLESDLPNAHPVGISFLPSIDSYFCRVDNKPCTVHSWSLIRLPFPYIAILALFHSDELLLLVANDLGIVLSCTLSALHQIQF